jgi:hypothetical protein
MSKPLQPVLMADVTDVTRQLKTHTDEKVHLKDFNDRELAFLEQMYEQVLLFKTKPSALQIQWLYQLYYKHIESDEEGFESWQEDHYDKDERLHNGR